MFSSDRAIVTTSNKSRSFQQYGWGPVSQEDISLLLLLTLDASSPSPRPLSLSFSGQEESGDSAPLSDQTLSSIELMAVGGRVKGLLSPGLEKLQLTLSEGREMSRQLVLTFSNSWLCRLFSCLL
jgi:hypothetical protein